jgi:MYND finger
MTMYDQCLENIHLAREAGYPANLLSKLLDLETYCVEEINRRSDGKAKKFEPKLSYPVSAENPNVADCIELVYNKKYGRHFITKRNLKVGDIVILDRPYQVYLLDEYSYQRCANCLTENQLNLIPCTDCSKTMFCSRSCMESAQKFHKILCPIVERSDGQSSGTFFAMRILLSLIHDFGSVKALAAARESRAAEPQLPKCGGDVETRQKNALDAFHDMEPAFVALNYS